MEEIIAQVLREFYETGIPSDVCQRPFDFLEKRRNATSIIGMRRTGKTYAAYQRMLELVNGGIPIERIVYINFDDERLRLVTVDDLHFVGEAHAMMYPKAAQEKCWYFLDELQNVDGWEMYARRLLDSPLVQLCITGSSSKLLSSEVATQLRGRSLDMEVFPLSFSEFLEFNSIVKHIPQLPCSSRTAGVLRNAMSRYLEEGGFPDVQGENLRIRNKLLQEYVNAVVLRDVIERHEISSVQALRYTLDYVMHNYARKVSTRAISGALKAMGMPDNREYISDYLRYFADAYLIYPVSIRTDSVAVRRTNPDKYYMVDTGLVRAMTPKNDAEKGWLLENLVFMQLRRGNNKIEYYINKKGGEVDFLVTDLDTKARRLIQVAWNMEKEETKDRELAAIRLAKDEIKVKDCSIVTWDTEGVLEDDINIVPIWKFCLEKHA
ncbi:ATP-binding protein [Fibrobacter sp.]|uniref:ATP-binding protein n=1 Tax=Fibrobacter sp. TaxID=35828 RepID=UPI00261D8F08|nr:ATP-binding protein [Fibrobacter sp.]MDD5942187.1 ATP-binding protein [Fibrobacter sp.]